MVLWHLSRSANLVEHRRVSGCHRMSEGTKVDELVE